MQDVSFTSIQAISIHSPYTGRDNVASDEWEIANEFQSTLPIQGETTGDYAGGNRMSIFQSTLPIQGETNPMWYNGGDNKFQSTLPIQGETTMDDNKAIEVLFQSTLPIQGETAILHINPLIYSQSLMQNAKQKNFFQHLHNKL